MFYRSCSTRKSAIFAYMEKMQPHQVPSKVKCKESGEQRTQLIRRRLLDLVKSTDDSFSCVLTPISVVWYTLSWVIIVKKRHSALNMVAFPSSLCVMIHLLYVHIIKLYISARLCPQAKMKTPHYENLPMH